MSLHSPLSPSSERSDTIFDDMLPPRRPIERMSSHPSLSQSSTTATSDDPHETLGASGEIMTPVDPSFLAGGVSIRDEEQELLSPTYDGRRGFRGLTKSMQSLRGRAKADKERSRSASRERPPVPVVEPGLKVAAVNRPSQPIPIPSATAQSTRPKIQRSGSSFSSFIRKLTGKSAKSPTPAPAVAAPPRPQPARTATARPSPPSRKPTLAIETGSNASTIRPAHVRKTSLPLDLAIAIPIEKPLEPAPLTAPARAPTMRLVDPRTVPLPPSPPSPAVVVADEEELDFSLSPTSYDRATSGGLSLQTSRTSKPCVDVDEEDEESDEFGDTLNPLPSSSTQATGRISTSPVSTLNEPDVRTPLSPSFPQNQDAPPRSPIALTTTTGGSPPKQISQTYVGSGGSPPTRRETGANLGRKESKWRKSVMNLSDTLNGQSKRVSKAPPSSYDAYMQQQQRMANNRRSCAPTLHSTGSVSAEIRQIKDKEQQDMADTFFLS